MGKEEWRERTWADFDNEIDCSGSSYEMRQEPNIVGERRWAMRAKHVNRVARMIAKHSQDSHARMNW